jgi:hypothetical protein
MHFSLALHLLIEVFNHARFDINKVNFLGISFLIFRVLMLFGLSLQLLLEFFNHAWFDIGKADFLRLFFAGYQLI